MHGSKPRTMINRIFFHNISGVITINNLIKESLQNLFGIPQERIFVGPDAVDSKHFFPIPHAQARERLTLARNAKLILYVGRILDWKGLEILPATAQLLGDNVVIGIVGGTRKRFIQITGITNIPNNLVFYGEQPFGDMPLWISAADAVLMTSTARNELSYRWTSPMKAFEYMACGVPIIAADTPSMREIVSTSNAFLYQPDDASSLAGEIRAVLSNPEEAQRRGDAALVASRACSWNARAEHIVQFIQKSTLTHA
jgi:glycosyltransferase involved in cell wall biosynthesis